MRRCSTPARNVTILLMWPDYSDTSILQFRRSTPAKLCLQLLILSLEYYLYLTGAGGTWSEFIAIHADSLWQIDFSSKRIWTVQGLRQIFALAFIHVGTRRVSVSPGSFKPDANWMVSQAQAFLT